LQITFVGDTLKLSLATGVDLSGYDTLEIAFQRPDGTTGVWTAAMDSTDHTQMAYTTSTTDLNMPGVWFVQAHVVGSGGIVVLNGRASSFKVESCL
jgi:hypothetical protein